MEILEYKMTNLNKVLLLETQFEAIKTAQRSSVFIKLMLVFANTILFVSLLFI